MSSFMRIDRSSYSKGLIFGLWGASGGAIGGISYIYPQSQIGLEEMLPVVTWIWGFAAFGFFTVAAISFGFTVYLKRPLRLGKLLTASLLGLAAIAFKWILEETCESPPAQRFPLVLSKRKSSSIINSWI